MKLKLIGCGLLSALSFSGTLPSAFAEKAKVLDLGPAHPALIKFHEQFKNETLVPIGDRVYAAFAYEYSNFSFIEGDDGIIVVDTGWFGDASQRALDALRKKTNKPIKAIIYTHVHADHFGGAGIFVKADSGKESPEIYAPRGWKQFREYSSSILSPMITKRAYAQFGMILPRGKNGTVGAGVGKVPTAKGPSGFIPPTQVVGERIMLEIAGVQIEIIPSPGDIYSSHQMVWLPEEKVLFSGDTLGGTFPYIETARFEEDRDPLGFVESLEIAQSLKPEYVVAGHGRLLMGREDVEDVLSANRDVIQYLTDQVDRLVLKDYTPDQMIDEIALPENLAKHPDLQPHYHRIDWMIRGMYLKRGGFVGDVMDLATLSSSQEASRLVKLLGGIDATLAASA